MTARRAAVTLLAVPALLACAAPRGRVSVLLGAAPGSPEEAQLADAVRDAVGGGGSARSAWAEGARPHGPGADSGAHLGPAADSGLACTPGSGAIVLRCAPATMGSGERVTVVVSRLGGTGYQVSVEEGFTLPGRTPAVCAVQDRIVRAVNAQRPGTARADPSSDCKR